MSLFLLLGGKMKIFLTIIVVFILFSFAGCSDNGSEDDVDNNPPDFGNETDDSSFVPDDVSEEFCTKDKDCGKGKICLPETENATYGSCIEGCSEDSDCSIGSCNVSLGRCINGQLKSEENTVCGSENCSKGCCLAATGLTGVVCDTEFSHCFDCSMCRQGYICMPSARECVTAECNSDEECEEINSETVLSGDYMWRCQEGICKRIYSGEEPPEGCAEVGAPCGMLADVATGSSNECCPGTDCTDYLIGICQ